MGLVFVKRPQPFPIPCQLLFRMKTIQSGSHDFSRLAAPSGSGCWLSPIQRKVIGFESSAPDKRLGVNRDFMKRTNRNNGIRAEYDFAAMKGGVRGKYVKRYREAS